jgi:hypothetical protein
VLAGIVGEGCAGKPVGIEVAGFTQLPTASRYIPGGQLPAVIGAGAVIGRYGERTGVVFVGGVIVVGGITGTGFRTIGGAPVLPPPGVTFPPEMP